MAAAVERRARPEEREELVKAALREYTQQVHVLPLHRQVIPWRRAPTSSGAPRRQLVEVAWVTVTAVK